MDSASWRKPNSDSPECNKPCFFIYELYNNKMRRIYMKQSHRTRRDSAPNPKWLRQSPSCWITCTASCHNHICLILHDLAWCTQNINFRRARFCLEMKRWTYRTKHKAPEGERPLGGYMCNMCYPCQETLLFSRLPDRSELEISCKNSSETPT